MSEEQVYEQELSCSHDCGSCSSNCSSRKPDKNEFLEPMNEYSSVKRVIGVVSGKGGVGKSFVTSYLSVLMNRKGYKTAVLDADVTGPSIPKAFGIHAKAGANELGILPEQTKTGIELMSVNLLLEEEETPVIWRGPVIAGTVKQFWSQVLWGEVDYMFVDMPPGTGDVPLTVFQSLPLDGIIIVTSPQELVSMIVSKAVNMAKAMDVPVLGLVENYSYITCSHCGEQLPVFGKSHIDEISAKFGVPVLAKLPLDSKIAEAADAGTIEGLDGNFLDAAADLLEEKFPASKGRAGKGNCKIAVAADESRNVYGHFGTASKFVIYSIENGVFAGKTELQSEGNGHEGAVNKLIEEGVSVIICGGIGAPAMEALMSAGILVIPGIQGNMDVAVASYLDGSISADSRATCSSHSHEDGEGCHCSGGCCH